MSIAAFAEFFSLFSSKPALINFEKARDMVQNYWTCDSSKAKRDFGYEQEIDARGGHHGHDRVVPETGVAEVEAGIYL